MLLINILMFVIILSTCLYNHSIMQQNWGVVDDIGVYGRDDTAYYLLRVMKKLQNFFNEIF